MSYALLSSFLFHVRVSLVNQRHGVVVVIAGVLIVLGVFVVVVETL